MICPDSGKLCKRDQCERVLERADDGTLSPAELVCGHDWQEAEIRCKECGEYALVGEMSFAVCAACRDEEQDREYQHDAHYN